MSLNNLLSNPFTGFFNNLHVAVMSLGGDVDAHANNINGGATVAAQVQESAAQVSGLHVEGLIADLALILVFGAIATLIFKKLKQPVVLGYIVAGFLASPHFSYLPTVADEGNIEFWAQLGIIVLLFSLGLEFSFKKLVNVGGSAVVTALIIVLGMMGFGFVVGRLLEFSFINCLFLGGMLSMSSTTIIIKAFTDLNLRQRKFASLVFAVLICEDLFAVIMMVILSSIALNNSVEGSEMLYSVLKLLFFLIIWFTVGVFVIPSFFNYFRRFINDELLLIIAMGMCFFMAVFSFYSGFSLALGAFVMGSILAGTCEAEHIEKVTKPVKDLFGAVFFISVGMMVDPQVIGQYIGPILLLSAVVIVGMITFGTFGMLLTGQSLRIAMESGFSLTQIGEFAFIIASLGLSLNVLEPTIYPIVVAVSVITTFFTPYFIRLADPSYRWVEAHLPARLNFLINRYSKESANVSEMKTIWKAVFGRYIWKILLYSSLIIAIVAVSRMYFYPVMEGLLPRAGRLIATVLTLIAMAPFLLALSYPTTKKNERERLQEINGGRTNVPLVVMSLFRIILAFTLVIGFLTNVYTHTIGVTFGFAVFVLLVVMLSTSTKKRLHYLESVFIRNLNAREWRRSGKNNNLVSDLHVAYMEVGFNCPFVGERLGNSNLRKNYGVNVVSIQRGANIYPIPTSGMRIFPGDTLGVIGNDEQIQRLLEVVEDTPDEVTVHPENGGEIKFTSFQIRPGSAIIGKNSAEIKLRDDYSSLLVAIQRGENEYIKPDGTEEFRENDILWVVGDKKKLDKLKQL